MPWHDGRRRRRVDTPGHLHARSSVKKPTYALDSQAIVDSIAWIGRIGHLMLSMCPIGKLPVDRTPFWRDPEARRYRRNGHLASATELRMCSASGIPLRRDGCPRLLWPECRSSRLRRRSERSRSRASCFQGRKMETVTGAESGLRGRDSVRTWLAESVLERAMRVEGPLSGRVPDGIGHADISACHAHPDCNVVTHRTAGGRNDYAMLIASALRKWTWITCPIRLAESRHSI